MKLTIPILVFLLASCSRGTGDEHITNKFLETELTRKMLKEYKSQDYRISLQGCDININEKSLTFNTTIRGIKNLLGTSIALDKPGIWAYPDAGVVVIAKDREVTMSALLDTLIFNMRDFAGAPNKVSHPRSFIKKDIFLISGAPVSRALAFGEFISNSKFTLDDFTISRSAYSLNYQCDGFDVEYYISSHGVWSYKGAGHLMFKDKPIENNSTPFLGVEVYVKRKKE